jgi:hypothetical protein
MERRQKLTNGARGTVCPLPELIGLLSVSWIAGSVLAICLLVNPVLLIFGLSAPLIQAPVTCSVKGSAGLNSYPVLALLSVYC